MPLPNEIILRPRFHIGIERPRHQLIELFLNEKKNQDNFGISCLDDHVFLKLPKEEQLFWSPQLHLEIIEISENRSTLQGFFGPNPTVWTMFIFFHVVVGTLFLANMIWTYSNYSLGNSINLQIGIAFGLFGAWAMLYLAGRIGKKKGKVGMQSLYDFMMKTLAQ